MKTKWFPRLHDDDTTQLKKRHLFIGVGGTRTHARPNRYPGLSPRLYPLSYDSDTVFQRTFLFNNYIDDTDDN